MRRASGEREAEVLHVLLRAEGPLNPGDVAVRLSGDPAYGTVVTVLSRMFEKGLLTRTKQGRAYVYAPVADAHGLTARRMRRELDSGTDRKAVLARFVDDLSVQDEQLLRQLLGDQPVEGPSGGPSGGLSGATAADPPADPVSGGPGADHGGARQHGGER